MAYDTHNWKAITSPTDAFTDEGVYVRPPFSPTRTVILAAETTATAEAAARTEKNFIVKECKVCTLSGKRMRLEMDRD